MNEIDTFVYQSLKPERHTTTFKAEQRLLDKYRSNLDYGPKNTGDITDLENIKYYKKKYFD